MVSYVLTVYLFIWERQCEHKWGEGQRERIPSRFPTEQGLGAWSQDPKITTSAKIKNPWLNWLSHPGTPKWIHFKSLRGSGPGLPKISMLHLPFPQYCLWECSPQMFSTCKNPGTNFCKVQRYGQALYRIFVTVLLHLLLSKIVKFFRVQVHVYVNTVFNLHCFKSRRRNITAHTFQTSSFLVFRRYSTEEET